MSEKYYSGVNKSVDGLKLKLKLASVLLKVKEHDLNMKNINDNNVKVINILEDHENIINDNEKI